MHFATSASGAVISACGAYRYALWRRWSTEHPAVLFIGLNPSTADATEDDPTIRRCIGFAKSLKYGGLLMGNLFAWRSTDPRVLLTVADPVGVDNDDMLDRLARSAAGIIVAWGAHGMQRGSAFAQRAASVTRTLSRIQFPYCLGRTKDGHPRHPLYLPADASIERYDGSPKRGR